MWRTIPFDPKNKTEWHEDLEKAIALAQKIATRTGDWVRLEQMDGSTLTSVQYIWKGTEVSLVKQPLPTGQPGEWVKIDNGWSLQPIPSCPVCDTIHSGPYDGSCLI